MVKTVYIFAYIQSKRAFMQKIFNFIYDDRKKDIKII